MSTTEQINAYLAWRSEREGKAVDVSPEAYERDRLIAEALDLIREGPEDNTLTAWNATWAAVVELVYELDELEDN
ncbi:hypothetical protein Pan2_47 [Pseudanabaena phage Pan2]|nr:hypothetical protein Pan2_47 [Pseudanabaena phage Pan2]